MIKYADVIVDLQAGDTGKGKVAHSLAKVKDEYNVVARYNGGGNAGHTVYHNGNKVVTHFVPMGVLYGITSIIGPGCVVDLEKLEEELDELSKVREDVRDYLYIDKRVHLITSEHKEEDGKDIRIGTTRTGNGPAYRNKYGRTGKRYGDEGGRYITDIYQMFHSNEDEVKILFEGAQGFELDIDWGDYPYVTSSHCTVGSAILSGVPPQNIRKVWGVAKAYRTYVGAKEFEGNDPIFVKIREVGGEYGATTGRPRQINWLDLDDLIMAANVNGVTDLVINKLDVLEDVQKFNLYMGKKLRTFKNVAEFVNYIYYSLHDNIPTLKHLTFSQTPNEI
jgi:adenylosuccinate synthase